MSDGYAFSLRRVAILVLQAGILAVGPFVVQTFGMSMIGFILLMCAAYCVPTGLAIVALYGSGRLRIFCLGALIPIAIQSISGSLNGFLRALDLDMALDRGVINGVLETLGIAAMASGAFAVAVHSLLVNTGTTSPLCTNGGKPHTDLSE